MSDKAVGWVRQAPGKALEWLGSIDTGGSTGYNPGQKSRLSITKDSSKSQVSLSVSSVTTEDSATYYCVTVYQKTTNRPKCPPGYGGRGSGEWRCYCGGFECWGGGSYGRGSQPCTWGGCSSTDSYEFHVDDWGQGLLITVSSEGE
nr:immunoglobulin mu heavy chain [Bos taurus]